MTNIRNRVAIIVAMIITVFITGTVSYAIPVGPVVKEGGKIIGKFTGKGVAKKTAETAGRTCTKMTPGLTRQVIQNFGDDAAKYLAKAPISDTTRLVSYGNYANNPATKKMLFNYYKKGGTKFLDNLSWKEITAGGLSVAAIIAAYQTSDGIQNGLKQVAEKSPEVFDETVSNMFDRITTPVIVPLTVLCMGWVLLVLIRSYRRNTKK